MKKQRLVLNKETIRSLQPSELQYAAGGTGSNNAGVCAIRSGTCGIFSREDGGCKMPIFLTPYIDPVP